MVVIAEMSTARTGFQITTVPARATLELFQKGHASLSRRQAQALVQRF
jgi:hypothetical protein